MSLIIFTDLDGSLMEHESYSIQPARQALEELRTRSIPLILNSSKTATEMATIQQALDLNCSFICENGAALYDTTGEITEFGPRRDGWLDDVHTLRSQRNYSFQGFSDWTPAEIATLTGLSSEQAVQAKTRSYSEPILWRDSESALLKFQNDLLGMDLQLLQGGRFMSIQGNYDKSSAMQSVINQQRVQLAGRASTVVALGDSPNDAAMLNVADIAVLIKSGKSGLIHCPDAAQIIHTKRPGPAGWNEAMMEILALYDSGQLDNSIGSSTKPNNQS
jgi:mannosyl-3-phosphoglycerate phosphatase